MTLPIRPPCTHGPRSQQGVVLIVALILLVVISLLAVTNMRGAASSEAISNNVRTTELATQAAEIALRHCEASAVRLVKNLAGDTTSAEATYSTNLTQTGMVFATTAARWQSVTATWDAGGTQVFVLPTTIVGTTTYKRGPECMVESLTGATPVSANAAFVITARGFGPEVASGTGRPQGSEVWLQSTIEIQ